MIDPLQPTDEGRRRYPTANGYNMDGENPADPMYGYPCTCEPNCQCRCAGECGCEACSLMFAMFSDVAGLSRFEPWTPADLEHALMVYRDIS